MKSTVDKLPLSGKVLNATANDSQHDDDLKNVRGGYSPRSILLISIIGIAIAEIIAMIVIYFFQNLPYYQQVLFDAAIMTAIIFPLLYFLSFRPLLLHIQQRYRAEQITEVRLRLMEFAKPHTFDELLRCILDEIENLTGSTISYFHFLEADEMTLMLQAGSTNTVKNMGAITGIDTNNAMDQTGIWADCIRQRQPVIHNDYVSLTYHNRVLDGHPLTVREMTVPIIRDEKIVAIISMGNKSRNFTVDDVELVSTLADFAWDIVKQKQAVDAIRESELKFRTLVDWTYDWEMWVNPEGNIIYNSPACKRITGYGPEEFIADPDLILRIIHPDDRTVYEKHQQVVHDESADLERIEYRVVAQNGEKHWMEHICRPLFGEDHRYLGRRVSNHDITERKQIEAEIKERNQREKTISQMIHTMQLDIARDLHDTVGQNISFLRMKLDHLDGKKTIKQAEIKTEIRNMARAANETYDLMRGTLAILQSTNSTDLHRLFIRYAEQIEERSTFKVDFFNQGEPKSLSAPRMRQIFYVFREIINNIEKHACASHLTIEMNWNLENLELIVNDNGKGFDMRQIQFGIHYGLKFMKERVELLNGSLDIHSEIGSGTKIIVLIPYE